MPQETQEDHHVWGENLADPAHADQVVELARRARGDAAPPSPRPTVVTFDGPAGSGKSSLARLVADRLDAPVVHLDDLLPGWDGLPAAPALLTTQVLVPLARGERAAFRRFDWHAGEFAELVPVQAADFLVVEGVASSVGVARAYADVRVWLEAAHDVRMQRGLARDGDGFAGHWEAWAAQEARIFEADGTAAHAHLRLQTDGPALP